MSDPKAGRPRQVTMAGWMIMAGSVIAVLLVAERLTGLHSLESRQSVERFLAEPPGSDLGIEVDSALSLIRTAAMITAGCATAAGILGYQVLRRSRSARVAVTILAVPIFLTGMVTGGFVTSVIAASAAILWLQPSRAWFNGTTPPERPARAVAASAGTDPWGRPAVGTPDQPHQWDQPAQPAEQAFGARPGAYPQALAGGRPRQVLAACIVTWVATGLMALALVATAVVLGLRSDVLLDEAYRQNPELSAEGVTDEMLIAATFVMVGVLLVWCIAAAVAAALVLRRVAWARILLLVSAFVASAACLVGAAIGAIVLLAPLAASITALALLLRSDVAAWFATPRR